MMRRTSTYSGFTPEDQHVTLLAVADKNRFVQIEHRRRALHARNLLLHGIMSFTVR